MSLYDVISEEQRAIERRKSNCNISFQSKYTDLDNLRKDALTLSF